MLKRSRVIAEVIAQSKRWTEVICFERKNFCFSLLLFVGLDDKFVVGGRWRIVDLWVIIQNGNVIWRRWIWINYIRNLKINKRIQEKWVMLNTTKWARVKWIDKMRRFLFFQIKNGRFLRVVHDDPDVWFRYHLCLLRQHQAVMWVCSNWSYCCVADDTGLPYTLPQKMLPKMRKRLKSPIHCLEMLQYKLRDKEEKNIQIWSWNWLKWMKFKEKDISKLIHWRKLIGKKMVEATNELYQYKPARKTVANARDAHIPHFKWLGNIWESVEFTASATFTDNVARSSVKISFDGRIAFKPNVPCSNSIGKCDWLQKEKNNIFIFETKPNVRDFKWIPEQRRKKRKKNVSSFPYYCCITE